MTKEAFAFPQSFAQQRLWFLDQLVPGSPLYNLPAIVRLSFPVDRAILERSFNEVIGRHETLRTTFVSMKGKPVQIVSPQWQFGLPLIDLRHLPNGERETEALRLAREEAQRSFDLRRGPLMRATLFRLGPQEHVLLMTMHHIISDGWSLGILWQELSTLYLSHRAGEPSPLPDLPIQYSDYAIWQRNWLQGNVLENQLSYWKENLADLPILALPTDKARPAMQTFRGTQEPVALGKDLTAAVHKLGQKARATNFMVLLAAFNVLLYRHSNQEDVVIGTPVAGRGCSELEGLIGFFVNPLVLRTSLRGDMTFMELLEKVRDNALGAYAHQDVPFEMLVERLQVTRDLSRNPLFQVMFQIQNAPTMVRQDGESASLALQVARETSIFDLALSLWETSEGFGGTVEYSTDLFERSSIKQMIAHFETLVQSIVNDPDCELSRLCLVTQAERRYLLKECKQTRSSYPAARSFPELFESQVQNDSQATALIFENEQVSYGELNRRANQLAHYLQRLGVGPEVLVGIMMERSVEMVASVLAVLKAGGAYVPLDPGYPTERLRSMVADSALSFLLRKERGAASQDWGARAQVVFLEEETETIAGENEGNPETAISTENLAYVIYTSGSTGKPKGVMIQHGGLANVVGAQSQTLDIRAENRILQFASLSFDASIFEIVMALGTGAVLCLGSQHELLPGPSLTRLISDRLVNTVTLPPSALKVLNAAECATLKTITVAGEPCSADLVAPWLNGNRRFFNLYGPTEATIWVTAAECLAQSGKPNIGRAIPHAEIYVLGPHLDLAPVGVVGELFVGGIGVARGYLGRADLTAERFQPNPFSQLPGARLYRTGDLVRYLPDGSLDYVGRKDLQVKIRGWRVELKEIEAALEDHESVKEAVVVVREERLVGYVVGAAGNRPNTDQLREHARLKLPEQMVPALLVVLEVLPRTPNGKVDRLHLPAPAPLHPELATSFVPPQTEMEKTIAAIWRKVLELDAAGIYDNFFDLGGHSLLLVEVYSRLRDLVDKSFPITEMFRYPTIHALGNYLTQDRAEVPSLQHARERAKKQKEALLKRQQSFRAKAQ